MKRDNTTNTGSFERKSFSRIFDKVIRWIVVIVEMVVFTALMVVVGLPILLCRPWNSRQTLNLHSAGQRAVSSADAWGGSGPNSL